MRNIKFKFYGVILLLLCICFACTVKEKSTLKETKIVIQSRKGYEVRAFDYSPKQNLIYYIEENSRIPKWKSTSEEPNSILRKMDLSTGTGKDVFMDFTNPPIKAVWLQIGENNKLFLYDNEYNDRAKDTRRDPRIIVLEKDRIVDEIPVLKGIGIDSKAGIKTELKDWDKTRKHSCSILLGKASEFQPIGYYNAHKVRFWSKLGADIILPRFLLIKINNEEFALDILDCGEEEVFKYKDQFKKNLLSLNPKANIKRSESQFNIQKNLYLKKISKGLGYYNFKCEKYYKVLYWGSERLVLKSCAAGFIEFPVSMNIIVNKKYLIYRKFRGIFKAELINEKTI